MNKDNYTIVRQAAPEVCERNKCNPKERDDLLGLAGGDFLEEVKCELDFVG